MLLFTNSSSCVNMFHIMEKEGDVMNFVIKALPMPREGEKSFWFLFHKDKLLVNKKDNNASIPFGNDLSKFNISIKSRQYLGRLNNHPCFTGEVMEDTIDNPFLTSMSLRDAYNILDEDMYQLTGTAFHIMNWDRSTEFCGKCGEKTEQNEGDTSKKCPACNSRIYPKITPAILVAVVKDNKILLAKNKERKSTYFSILAGHVEPGETLEEAVSREVKEEVGIEVKNIKYFGSQPFPNPDRLMIGFTAEHSSGEIEVDNIELYTAEWYTVDNMPEIPSTILGLSKRLINWFVENNK